jgi:hypothetical protein
MAMEEAGMCVSGQAEEWPEIEFRASPARVLPWLAVCLAFALPGLGVEPGVTLPGKLRWLGPWGSVVLLSVAVFFSVVSVLGLLRLIWGMTRPIVTCVTQAIL